MSQIVFDKISKSYEGQRVIEELDLEIRDGELLVLVGPSGCGKSTLLRMLAGLDEIDGGEIRIDGLRLNELPPQRRRLAMVFQNYALYPHMTVRDNLAFPLKMQRLGKGEIARRVEQTAALLDLTSLLERRPRQLSGGQRQRVAMGRAVVREAAAFLMDEPLSNLDAKLRSQIRGEIADLQARLGTTTLYVTHDQVEAMTLGQRIAVMRRGRLQQVAEPHRIYQQPANIFVAGFIGNPGMNLFRTRLLDADGALAIDLAGRPLPLPAQAIERHPGIDDWRGRELLAGIRPEAISLAQSDHPHALPAKLRLVESLGHETLIHADCALATIGADDDPVLEATAAPPWTAALPGHQPLKPGDRLHLCLAGEGLCLFEPGGDAIGATISTPQAK
jgi:multiple sugar transport system ATP-binding protein